MLSCPSPTLTRLLKFKLDFKVEIMKGIKFHYLVIDSILLLSGGSQNTNCKLLTTN